jgi:hypothetical protein
VSRRKTGFPIPDKAARDLAGGHFDTIRRRALDRASAAAAPPERLLDCPTSIHSPLKSGFTRTGVAASISQRKASNFEWRTMPPDCANRVRISRTIRYDSFPGRMP